MVEVRRAVDPFEGPWQWRQQAQAQAAAAAQQQAQKAAEASSTVIPEVYVTATKRSTSLQRTPVAVTALSAAALGIKGENRAVLAFAAMEDA